MKLSRTSQANRSRAASVAFSVIEIMLAVSLLAVIIVGLLAMFYQVQRAFRLGTAQVDVMEAGRATMSVLTRDLRGATATRFDFVTNMAIVPSPPGSFNTMNLPSGNQRTNYLRDLFFLSKIDNDQYVFTSYRISNAVSGVGTLYRFDTSPMLVDPSPALARQMIANTNRFMAEARPDREVSSFHQVVDGVLNLTATAYDLRGDIDYTNAFAAAPYSFAYTGAALPAFIDLELVVLEPGAVEKYRARAEVNPVNAQNFLAQQVGRAHVFRQRVAIGSTNYFN